MSKLPQVAVDILQEELDQIKFDTILEGSNDHFYIKPTFRYLESGDVTPIYGVFNRATNLKEAESAQYMTARAWVDSLTDVATGEITFEPIMAAPTTGALN